MKQLPITTAEIWAVHVPLNANDEEMFTAAFDAMPLGKFKILGTCTKDDIDFDPAAILNSVYNGTLKTTFYHDYGQSLSNMPSYPHRDRFKSLRSAIKAAGYYFDNPYGDKSELSEILNCAKGLYAEFPEDKLLDSSIKQYDFMIERIEAAQHSVIEKLVIIKKVTPCKK